MELELVPLIMGGVVALLGIGLVADAWLPDSEPRIAERRRRARAERHRGGEGLIGVGMLALAAALAGRDVWRWSTVAVLAGVLCLVVGAALNGRFLAERLVNRGKARRGRGRERRSEQAADRPVPLMVAAEADRRNNDRRDLPGEPPAHPPVSRESLPAQRPRSPADRPIARRIHSD